MLLYTILYVAANNIISGSEIGHLKPLLWPNSKLPIYGVISISCQQLLLQCHILCCRKSYPVLHRVLHPSIDLTTIVDKLFTHFYTWTNILFAATSMQSKVSRQLTHRVYKYTTYEQSKQLFSTLYIISLISSFSNFLTFSQVFQADSASSLAGSPWCYQPEKPN